MKKTLKSFFLITIIRDKLVFILLLSIKQDISLFVGVVLYLCFHKKAPVKSEMCNRPLLVIDLVIDHLFFSSNRNRNRSFLQNSNRNRNPVKKICI